MGSLIVADGVVRWRDSTVRFQRKMCGLFAGFRENHPIAYGSISTVFACVFFASSNLSAKLNTNLLGAEVAVIRAVFMIVATFVFCRLKKWTLLVRGKRKTTVLLFLRGLTAAVGSISVFTAVQYVPLPIMTSLQYMSVVFTVVLARIFLGEKFRLIHVPTILVSIFGVLLVSNPQLFVKSLLNDSEIANQNETTSTTHMAIGVSLALLTAFAQASAFCLVRKLSHGENRVKNIVLIFNFSLISLPFLLLFSIIYRLVQKLNIVLNGADFGFSVMAAVFGLLAQVFANIALKKIDAGYFSLVRGMEIAFSFVFQVLFFGISDHYLSYIGIVLIFVSVSFINLEKIVRSRMAAVRKKASIVNHEVSDWTAVVEEQTSENVDEQNNGNI